MTVPTTPVDFKIYTGDDTTAGPFTFLFQIQTEGHLQVGLLSPAGVHTTLVETTNYTVADAGDPGGGSITLVNASGGGTGDNLGTGYKLILRRVPPQSQEAQIKTLGKFDAAIHETAFDKQTMVAQSQQYDLDRASKLPSEVPPTAGDATGGINPNLPEPAADEYVGWNSAADALENKSVVLAGTLSFVGGNKMMAKTGASQLTARDIVGGTGINVADGDGQAGDPTISVPNLGIDTPQLADGAVETAKLDDEAVTSAKLHQDVIAQLFQARLTFDSGNAVPTTDLSNRQTTYLTPYKGNKLALYDNASSGNWKLYSLTEISIAHPTPVSFSVYDVFVADVGAGPVLSMVEWTNTTTRATAIVLKDGVYVKSGDFRYRYCGSVAIDNIGDSADTKLYRYLWNYYNRVPRYLERQESTASWQYTVATWRQAGADVLNQVEVVIGVSEDPLEVSVDAAFENTNANVSASIGLGLDRTNGNDAIVTQSNETDGAGYIENTHARYRGFPGIGYHYLSWVEWSEATGTTTWYGVTGTYQSGMMGEILA